jgi:hypothetical protein
MPIENITSTHLSQRCVHCLAENSIALSSLHLGFLTEGGEAHPNAIVLPACACGCRETLQRTWDECPSTLAGSPFDLHRRTVNALASELKSKGRVAPALRALIEAEADKPQDLRELIGPVPLNLQLADRLRQRGSASKK